MISSVIAEFNPFHNGHGYLLSRAKSESDAVICVMSGNFVQRGDLAIFDKYKRTEFALKNGADLVINLPVGWSMSTAENFAYGGVSLLKNTGIVDKLIFGSECGDIDTLTKTAEVIQNPNFDNLVKEFMKDGITYALARQKAVESYSELLSETLSKPNNTLAIEYILAAKKLNFSPAFSTISRVGAEHDSLIGNDEFISATALRELIRSNKYEEIKKYVPENIYDDIINCNYSDINRLDSALMFKLRSLEKADFLNVPDVSEGLENRIVNNLKISDSFSELIENVKTKRYTMARLRRILTCAAFGVTNEFLKKEPPYIHVLGCTEKGEELIKEISKKSEIPLIINAKDAVKLEGFAKKTFELEETTSGLYALSFSPTLKSFSHYDKKFLKL